MCGLLQVRHRNGLHLADDSLQAINDPIDFLNEPVQDPSQFVERAF
jgi:hypothetical protein